MKTAVIGEGRDRRDRLQPGLVDLARHYGFHPKGLPALSGQNQGQGRAAVPLHPRGLLPGPLLPQPRRPERATPPLARHGGQPAGARHHHGVSSTKPSPRSGRRLRPLPLAPFRSVLKLERRISREGMVSVGGNFYSVPDATRRRTVEVHTLADEIRIFEDGVLIAAHPVLEGRQQAPRPEPGHRSHQPVRRTAWTEDQTTSSFTAPATRSPSDRSPSTMPSARAMAREQRP